MPLCVVDREQRKYRVEAFAQQWAIQYIHTTVRTRTVTPLSQGGR